MVQYMVTRRELRELIDSLAEEQWIEIHWLDACLTKNVSRLTNPVFATYKKTKGRFWRVKEDSLYRREHLIIKKRTVDYDTYNIISIPLDCIVLIKKLPMNFRFKTYKSGTGEAFLESRQVATIPREEGVGRPNE